MVDIKHEIPLPSAEAVRIAAAEYGPPDWHREEDDYCIKVTNDQSGGGGGFRLVMVFKTIGKPCKLG